MVQLRELWRGHRRVSVLTPGETIAEARARAGLVLLDVPCSNTGVLARRVEAKHRCGPEQIARLVTLQRQIIDSAVPLLAPGGRLLYSTCSIEPEENSAQVAWAVGNLPLAVERESITHPAGAPGGPAAEYHDGAFAALLACR
jgi:16S rRNA (cytosine967-C5)-methyltransferase